MNSPSNPVAFACGQVGAFATEQASRLESYRFEMRLSATVLVALIGTEWAFSFDLFSLPARSADGSLPLAGWLTALPKSLSFVAVASLIEFAVFYFLFKKHGADAGSPGPGFIGYQMLKLVRGSVLLTVVLGGVLIGANALREVGFAQVAPFLSSFLEAYTDEVDGPKAKRPESLNDFGTSGVGPLQFYSPRTAEEFRSPHLVALAASSMAWFPLLATLGIALFIPQLAEATAKRSRWRYFQDIAALAEQRDRDAARRESLLTELAGLRDERDAFIALVGHEGIAAYAAGLDCHSRSLVERRLYVASDTPRAHPQLVFASNIAFVNDSADDLARLERCRESIRRLRLPQTTPVFTLTEET